MNRPIKICPCINSYDKLYLQIQPQNYNFKNVHNELYRNKVPICGITQS